MLHEELALDLPPNSDAAVDGAGEEEGRGWGGEGGKEAGTEGREKRTDSSKKKEKNIRNSIVLDIFAGKLVSEVVCKTCGKVTPPSFFFVKLCPVCV